MECVKSVFEYFRPTLLQTGVENSSMRMYAPISAPKHGSTIQFDIPGSDKQYYDLGKSYMQVSCKLTKADGTSIGVDVKAGPVNSLLQSLFTNVEININGTIVSEPDGLHHYKAMYQDMLTYDAAVHHTQLLAGMWIKDTAAGIADTNALEAGTNVGLKTRAAYFKNDAIVQLMGPIHDGIFHQPLAIPSNCPIKIRFVQNKDAFVVKCLAADGEQYKCIITEMALWIHTLEVSNELSMAHEQMLREMNMRFPYKRTTMKHLTIPNGQTSIAHDNAYLGKIPDRVVIGFVLNSALAGDYHANGYYFQTFKLNYLVLSVNGQLVPGRPFQPDYANKRYIREYMSLFEGTGTLFTNRTMPITLEDYIKGSALYVFDLTPDLSCGDCASPPRNGNVRIEAKFSVATTAALDMVCLAEFRDMFEIDQDRNVILHN